MVLRRAAGPEPHGSVTAEAGLDPQGSLLFKGAAVAAGVDRPQGSTGVAGLAGLPA